MQLRFDWSLRWALGMAMLAAALPATADRFDTIRTRINQRLVEQSVPSLAVAVAQNGKIIWEEGFGWADRERRLPATEHTVYSLASISKPITATGLMALVRDGKVDLDRPIDDYLGSAKLRARIGKGSDATVRRVANHTAGLPLHAQFFYVDEPFRRPPMDETIRRYANVVTPPGEQYQYSNLGYGLLDYVIERASGQSYTEFMRREVFMPLGMTRTSIDIGPGLEPYVATRYELDGTPIPFYDFDHPGGSAVFASAHDLVRFGMFHLKNHLPDQKAILSDALIDAMHRPTADRGMSGPAATRSKGPLTGYSVGFSIDERNGYHMVSHSGSMGGVATQMLLLPKPDLAIVVLSNSRNSVPSEIAEAIAAEMLPDWKPTPPRKPRGQAPAFVTPPQLAGTWRGKMATYVKDVPVEVVFQPDGDVHVKLGDQLPTLVYEPSLENGLFSGEFAGYIDTPDTARYDHTVQLALNLREQKLNGTATAVTARVGKVTTARLRSALSSWVELSRVSAAAAQ